VTHLIQSLVFFNSVCRAEQKKVANGSGLT